MRWMFDPASKSQLVLVPSTQEYVPTNRPGMLQDRWLIQPVASPGVGLHSSRTTFAYRIGWMGIDLGKAPCLCSFASVGVTFANLGVGA